MDGRRDAAAWATGGRREAAGGELRLFLFKVGIVALVVATLFIAWRVAVALLLVFAGVLLATLLLRLTGGVRRLTGWAHGGGLATVLVTLGVVLALGGWLSGATIAAQFGQLSSGIDQGLSQLPEDIRSRISEFGSDMPWLSGLRAVASGLFSFIAYFIIAVFAGVYLAVSPGVYRRGILLLVPPSGQARAAQVLDTMGNALWKWLLGQLLSMLMVGVLTALMLWALGVPAALALGLIAFALEFIPFLGPWIAAVPGVLIAFTVSPGTALWAIAGYVLIQQLEGNLVLPMAERRMVDLPPVITIGAVMAGGLLFGVLGAFLATPLAVAVMVLVNLLYIEDRLGERARFPG